MTPAARSALIRTLAKDIGFDLVGVTHAGPSNQAAYYRDWLAAGHAGNMGYLHRNVHLRTAPAGLLDDARSVVCVALLYGPGGSANRAAPGPGPDQPTGQVARYARGMDYHLVMREMLATLEQQLRGALAEPFAARVCVDTAPLLERELAARAGLGWIGKNTLVLHPQLGSYFFLGELLTTLDLAADRLQSDHCGTCTKCLEACPTQAFPAPYQMDASRCISYLTIENRGEIPGNLQAGMGDWVFGCDVCQEVCPFNTKAPRGAHPEVMREKIPARLPLAQLVDLDKPRYNDLTAGTAAERATPRMWRRSAAIALRNWRSAAATSAASSAGDAADRSEPA